MRLHIHKEGMTSKILVDCALRPEAHDDSKIVSVPSARTNGFQVGSRGRRPNDVIRQLRERQLTRVTHTTTQLFSALRSRSILGIGQTLLFEV